MIRSFASMLIAAPMLFSAVAAQAKTPEQQVAFIVFGLEDGAQDENSTATLISTSPAVYELLGKDDWIELVSFHSERRSPCIYTMHFSKRSEPDNRKLETQLDFSKLTGFSVRQDGPGLRRVFEAGPGFCTDVQDNAPCQEMNVFIRESNVLPATATAERMTAALMEFQASVCKPGQAQAAELPKPAVVKPPVNPSIEEAVGFLATSYADGLVINGLKASRTDDSPAVFELSPAAGGAAVARLMVDKRKNCRYRISLEAMGGSSVAPYAYTLNLGTTFGYGFDMTPEGAASRGPLSDDPEFCVAESGEKPCLAVQQQGPALPAGITQEYLRAMFKDFGARICAAGLSIPPPPSPGVTAEELAALLWLGLEDGAAIGPDKVTQTSESPAVFDAKSAETGADVARISVTRKEGCLFSYRFDYAQENYNALGEPFKEFAFDVDFAKATGRIERFSNEPNDFQFETKGEMCTPVAPTQDCYMGQLSNSPLLPLNADRGEDALLEMKSNYCKTG